jgi:predicted GNAT family N-acyltransferase
MVEMQISAEQLRLMNVGDVAAAVELSCTAGWNQTSEDWHMLLELAPDGCFGVEADGRLVATTTSLCYQQRLAWIGMVLTHPKYRGRGFARRLICAALDRLESMRIETIKLDATEHGRPLYESFGFQAEQPVERWSRSGLPRLQAPETRPAESKDPSSLSQVLRVLDSQAFVADRSIMLHELAQRSILHPSPNAFLFARAGRATEYLGPCIAADPAAARAVIARAVNTSAHTGWSWDLLPANKDGVTLASELGFIRQRCLTRMVRGKPLHGRDEMVYAIAGFELG